MCLFSDVCEVFSRQFCVICLQFSRTLSVVSVHTQVAAKNDPTPKMWQWWILCKILYACYIRYIIISVIYLIIIIIIYLAVADDCYHTTFFYSYFLYTKFAQCQNLSLNFVTRRYCYVILSLWKEINSSFLDHEGHQWDFITNEKVFHIMIPKYHQ